MSRITAHAAVSRLQVFACGLERSAAMERWCSRDQSPLGGKHGSGAGIGGRALGAEIGPGLEIVERINDPTTDLSIFRSGAVGAVLFERAAGQTEEASSLGRPQKAWRQTGQWVGHVRPP